MKKYFLLLILIICFFVQHSLVAQRLEEMAVLRTFQDSVFQALTVQVDESTAQEFREIWFELAAEQKKEIRKQVMVMKRKKYPTEFRVNYYKALVGASLDRENTTDDLATYLHVAGQSIDYDLPQRVNLFFKNIYRFFAKKMFYESPLFRLHALHFSYTIDYYKGAEDPLLIMGQEQEEDPSIDNEDISEKDAWDQEDTFDDDSWDETDSPYQGEKIYEGEQEPIDDHDSPPAWMEFSTPPDLTGPVLKFDRITLNFVTLYDSVFVKKTKGSLSLEENIFVGEGGIFDWSSVGLSADSTYYTFHQYNFDVTVPTITSEQGALTYKGNFKGEVKGSFEFRNIQHKDSLSALYPLFKSFNNNVHFDWLDEYEINLTGGFVLEGRNRYSASINRKPSSMKIMNNGKKKIFVLSQKIEFHDSLLVSKQAVVSIHQRKDSIYHPSISFRYDYSKRKLILQRTGENLNHASYHASYFKVGFLSDKIEWNDLSVDSLSLHTYAGRGQNPMVLESINFYDPQDFRELAGQGFDFHPLVVVVDYATRNQVNEFYESDLAQSMNKPLEYIQLAMDFLAERSMIDYVPEEGIVKLKQRAYNFVEARRGTRDYDNIKMHSIVDGVPNATLLLNPGEIKLKGVEKFKISDSLNVYIQPKDDVISLLKNREFQFDGSVSAGKFEVYGKKFKFKYDSFLILLKKIDSIQFYVIETDARGRKKRVRISNAMMGADSTSTQVDASRNAGTLYINRPNNKSGQEKIPSYPRLDAEQGGVIYFDRKEVLNGAYDRSIYYVTPPFKLDSLNNSDSPAIMFDGTFYSSGMVPNFEQKLRVRADKSLGFIHYIPTDGYPLYTGQGTLKGVMNLSNKGIRVNGEINYLSASVMSSDFIFYPDSVVTQGIQGKMEEKIIGQAEFPKVSFLDYSLKWIPSEDKFTLKNGLAPFYMYDHTAMLYGTLFLSKRGLRGRGKLTAYGITETSEDMVFNAKKNEAHHASFHMKTPDMDVPFLAGEDVLLRIDFENKHADIIPEIIGQASLEFPRAQFKTSIPEAYFDFGEGNEIVTMKKDSDTPLEDSYFYSTNPDLDSLNFYAEKAEYNIREKRLNIEGVPFIVVADAKIIPYKNKISIAGKDNIEMLEQADIIIDTLNGYHHLTEAKIKIISRTQFSGRAIYRYVNVERDTFLIKMTDFKLEPIQDKERRERKKEHLPTSQTVTHGEVMALDSLVLSPKIYYKGNITMYATRPSLQLNGSIKLDFNHLPDYDTWIQYEHTGYEKEIHIPFDNAITEGGKKIVAGLHFSSDYSLYATFAFGKKNTDDEDFFLPQGSIFYDKEKDQFRIEDMKRVSGEKLTGQSFSYNERTQEIKFEGEVNFLGQRDKQFDLIASVLGKGNLKTKKIAINSLIIITLRILPQSVVGLMAEDLAGVVTSGNFEEGQGEPTELLYKLAGLLDEKTLHDFETKSLEKYTPLTTLQGMTKTFVFSNIHLQYADQYKAFYSVGQLGLSNVFDQDINASFEGMMEIKKNEDGSPVVHLFIKASEDHWYYFGLEDNQVLMYSSNEAINKLVQKQTRASKSKIEKMNLSLGSEEETLLFINRFREEYYDILTPYNLYKRMDRSGSSLSDQPIEDSLDGGSKEETKEEEEEEEEDDGF